MKDFLINLKEKEIFLRLFFLSLFCTAFVSLIAVTVIITKAQKTYTNSYQESNDIIVSKIENDYEQMIQSINQSFDYIEKNNYIESFLTAPKNDVNSIIFLKKELDNDPYIQNKIPANLVLIGLNERSFYQNQTTSNQSIKELLSSSLIESINSKPSVSQIYFRQSGMTTTDENSPGVLFTRRLERNSKLYGYAFFFIPEASFSSVYSNSLDPSLHSTLIVDEVGTIISSSEKSKVGSQINSKKIKATETVKLTSYNYTFYDTINHKTLIKNMNLKKTGLIIFIIGFFFSAFFSFFLFKKITAPIYSLMGNLQNTTEQSLTHSIELTGTYETKQLGKTYNQMLSNLEVYINDLLKAEKENHLMEIKALQMQIHPHFIYNTLTAIKFLSWKGEHEKVVEAIDSFINLLQQTFNNQEIVTLKTELAITTDYINLLKIRYGTQIETFLFTDKDCENMLVPKMIIQPIIENSYLHAFPDNRKGSVQIFTKKKENQLHIDIIDNGIGFNQDDISELNSKSSYSRNYSSIGLNNINDRIKLLYGSSYGAFISSKIGKGTFISLILPIKYPSNK